VQPFSRPEVRDCFSSLVERGMKISSTNSEGSPQQTLECWTLRVGRGFPRRSAEPWNPGKARPQHGHHGLLLDSLWILMSSVPGWVSKPSSNRARRQPGSPRLNESQHEHIRRWLSSSVGFGANDRLQCLISSYEKLWGSKHTKITTCLLGNRAAEGPHNNHDSPTLQNTKDARQITL
jgi:hypothetical protein